MARWGEKNTRWRQMLDREESKQLVAWEREMTGLRERLCILQAYRRKLQNRATVRLARTK